MDKDKLTKLYYSIGEVAALINVNSSTIRFWEKQFDQLSPKKNKKGNRLFTPSEIQLLSKIEHLLHHQGYTIEGAKIFLKEINTKEKKEEEVIKKLIKIKKNLDLLKNKI